VSFLADLKYSARSFLRAPAMTLTLLLTIALGIGSNATVLGFIRGLVSRDLPLPGIETVVSLFAREATGAFGPLTYEDVLAVREARVFVSAGAARESQTTIEIGGRTSVMSVAAVTPELFDLLRLPPDGAVIISRRAWRTEFADVKDVRHERVRIDGVEMQIADIAPDWLEGLYFGRDVDVWTTLDEAALGQADRQSRTLWALARLPPGVSARRAESALIASGRSGIAVQPYTGITPDVAGGMHRVSRLLPAAAGAVFFIACANVAAFLLARSSARSQETSVRVALGASRAQLGRQLFADSLLISAAGGALGVLLASWTAGVIPALFFEQDAEHLVFAPDLVTIVVASAACVTLTVACGLVPFLEVRRDDPAAVLRRESAGPSNAMRRLRTGLVVTQMSCCCLLVISTGVLLEGFHAALRTAAGDRLGEPVLARLEARGGFDRLDLGLEYFRTVEQSIQSLPGVSSTAWVGALPGSRPSWTTVRVEPPDQPLHDVVIDIELFTPRSLSTVVVPPVAGRMFGGRDTTDACPVAILNEEAAAEMFDGDAVGRAVYDPSGQRVEIIGVVATKKLGRSATVRPTIYYYAEQTDAPLGQVGPASFRVPGPSRMVRSVLASNVVSSTYFGAMGLEPAAGEVFSDRPRPRGCRVGVINQEAAELYFGGHAIGGALIDGAGRRTEIIGVVRSPLLRTSQRQGAPAVYLPLSQDFQPRMTLLVGTQRADDALLISLRRTLSGIQGGAALGVTTLDAHLSRTALAAERIATTLVGASAAMALVLGGLGMYGAMAESARQRRREIALRLALGAQSWRVIRQVLVEGLRLAGAGTFGGIVGSLLVARWLSGITASSSVPPLTVWLAAPLVLIAAVVAASVLPARRALAVSPLSIMRDN
jgi:putative ABC transport system permease protein